MREVELLIGGIIVGLMIAMPVGPVNILCIHRTIEGGWRSVVISGLGAAAADILYGGVAGFSITLVVQFLVREQFWIRFIGGILLVVIGSSYFFKRPEPLNTQKQDRGSAHSDLRSTFLLTLTNPTTVLSFLALLAVLGMGNQRQWWLADDLGVGVPGIRYVTVDLSAGGPAYPTAPRRTWDPACPEKNQEKNCVLPQRVSH
jgi:threonine/homoserine/homoserine lactone efflux protein